MQHHPVTLVLGGVGVFLLLLLTVTGLSCSVYILEPDTHQHLKFLYELAKLKKIC